jgi:hypothetical protein
VRQGRDLIWVLCKEKSRISTVREASNLQIQISLTVATGRVSLSMSKKVPYLNWEGSVSKATFKAKILREVKGSHVKEITD